MRLSLFIRNKQLAMENPSNPVALRALLPKSLSNTDRKKIQVSRS